MVELGAPAAQQRHQRSVAHPAASNGAAREPARSDAAVTSYRPPEGSVLMLNSLLVMTPSPFASCWSKLRCEYGHSPREMRRSPLVSIVANGEGLRPEPISALVTFPSSFRSKR